MTLPKAATDAGDLVRVALPLAEPALLGEPPLTRHGMPDAEHTMAPDQLPLAMIGRAHRAEPQHPYLMSRGKRRRIIASRVEVTSTPPDVCVRQRMTAGEPTFTSDKDVLMTFSPNCGFARCASDAIGEICCPTVRQGPFLCDDCV